MSRDKFFKFLGINQRAKFIANPIKKLALQLRRQEDDSFSIMYNKNITIDIYKYLLFKASNWENLNICVFSAQQRSGKSSVAISLGLFFSMLINYQFSVKSDIFPSQISYLNKIGNRIFNSLAVVDEYIETHAQIGAYLTESSLRDISKITAKELLHSIQIYRFLPADLNALIALEPIGKDFKNGQLKCLVYDIESFQSDMSKSLLGYCIIPHYDKSVIKYNHFDLMKLKTLSPIQKFRLDYEKKKDIWNKDIVLRKPTDRLKDRIKYSRILIENHLFNKVKTQRHKIVIARSLCPSDFGEDEIREVITMAELNKIKKDINTYPLEKYINK